MFGLSDGGPAWVELRSPLSPEECARRLWDSSDRSATFRRHPVIGWMARGRFHGHKRVGSRNSWKTCVTATLLDDGGRTRIRCRFGVNRGVIVFTAIWFGGVLMMGVMAMADALSGAAPAAGPLSASVAALAMLALGYGTLRRSRSLARDERRFLMDYLCTTLDSRSIASDNSSPPPD